MSVCWCKVAKCCLMDLCVLVAGRMTGYSSRSDASLPGIGAASHLRSAVVAVLVASVSDQRAAQEQYACMKAIWPWVL
jgi:hypothetical protein